MKTKTNVEAGAVPTTNHNQAAGLPVKTQERADAMNHYQSQGLRVKTNVKAGLTPNPLTPAVPTSIVVKYSWTCFNHNQTQVRNSAGGVR